VPARQTRYRVSLQVSANPKIPLCLCWRNLYTNLVIGSLCALVHHSQQMHGFMFEPVLRYFHCYNWISNFTHGAYLSSPIPNNIKEWTILLFLITYRSARVRSLRRSLLNLYTWKIGLGLSFLTPRPHIKQIILVGSGKKHGPICLF